MLANAITDHIKTLGVFSDDFAVRTGRIEASAKRAVMVKLPLSGFNEMLDQTGYYRGNQQIIVRSPDPEEAYNLSVQLQEALTVLGSPLMLTGWKLSNFRPLGLPLLFPLNDGDFYETSLNFDTRAYRA